ncbi:hypothetical protein ILUMI_19305 [Ignelater luminosus]|uniref:Peroxisomal membrane protein PMP34 n=1 Tax=Ignelater luminosus TaxID=2038154 RepID=A0A8K0CGF7_IGNLU|nr:hypothetical protein ILUMI_19305 [Ignelater luminosus]
MASQTSLLSYETCAHAIAGSVGSMFAMSVFYPLDTVKFRKQLEEVGDTDDDTSTFAALYKILQSEGLSALYAGITPCLTSLGTSSFVYFYTFHGLKKWMHTSTQNDLFIGIAAGVINVLISTPLWVVNSRLKVKENVPYTGLVDGIIYVGRNEGLGRLWSGLCPSLILVSNPAVQFAVYEYLKRRISVKSSFNVFLMGAVAKAIATVVTYPLQLAQARLRYGKEGKMGLAALLLCILKKRRTKSSVSWIRS